MARIRTVKPDFWTDEKVVELTAFARLLFIGLWNFADDDGRMVYSPKRIKMQIFPSDDLNISELFGELRRESLITIYTIDNVDYLQVTNFTEHQKIDKRTASKHPAPPNPPELPRIPTTEGKGMEGNLKTPVENLDGIPCKPEMKTPTPLAMTEGFNRFWQTWPKSQRKVGKVACAKRWKGRGLDAIADRIIAHVDAMKKTEPWRTGFEPSPETYINQSRWEDELPEAPDKPDGWKNNPAFAGVVAA